MRVKQLAGALVVSAFLLTATAHANPEQKDQVQQQLSPAEQEVMNQLKELHRAHHQKLKADAQALLDKAVKEGKITQAQADNLKRFRGRRKWHKLSEAELKGRLEQAVKDGRMAPERAEEILRNHAQDHK